MTESIPSSFAPDFAPETVPAEEPVPPPAPFDLLGADTEALSFSMLQASRQSVFYSSERLENFRRQMNNLAQTGEEGRRRGLGLWMLGDFEAAAQALEPYADDPVAVYTRAKALFTLGKLGDAQPLFEKLSERYPEHAPPRAGALEVRFEKSLADGDEDAAIAQLDAALASAPEEFRESPEGQYLLGRAAEAKREDETAIEHYERARELDPTLRPNLFRGAHLAERNGLDDEALEFYETLILLKPADRRALINLGILYEDLGRDQDAASCYDLVARWDPTDQRARLFLEDARSAMDMYYDEDLERKEDRLNQILRIPITDFELSVRARNCLNKMNINTLGDLVCRTEQELLSYKNFGETSLNEIKEILHSKGLRLGMPREEAVASVEMHNRRVFTGENAELLNKPIIELQLSIRARRTVEALGCLTVGDITKHSEDELLGMPNFGVTSLQELKAKLSELGLALRDASGS